MANLKTTIKTGLSAVPLGLAAYGNLRDAIAWLRWRASRRPYPAGDVLRLHLGCGDVDYPGFVNLDARPQPHVHHVQRIDRLKAFADDSVSLIYVSHCLEHFSHLHVVDVLREWRRVLKPGGVLRISVPDFDLMVATYLDTGRDMRSILLALMGGQDYPFNFHYTCFNEAELSRLMLEAGLKAPRKWTFGTEPYTSLPDWSGRSTTYKGAQYPVSLNLEANK